MKLSINGTERDVSSTQVEELVAELGLPLAAVSWGFRGRRALAETGAAVIVDTAEEIV